MTATSKQQVIEFGQKYPDALRLAVLVSLAVRVEPALLRQTRLHLLPDVDAGAEADLWFSPLVEARNVTGMVFNAEIQEDLRLRLKAGKFLHSAWQITEAVHRHISPLLLLEEKLAWLALSGREAEMKTLIRSVLATLHRNPAREGIAQWAARAIPRFPEAAKQLEETQMLAWAAPLRLGLLKKTAGGKERTPLPKWLAEFAPKDLPLVPCGVTLYEGGLEFCSPPPTGTHKIELLGTDELWVEVSWQERRARRVEEVRFRPNQPFSIQVPSTEIELKTLLGQTYRITKAKPAQERPYKSYKCDLFISYSHADDKALSKDAEGWVTALHEQLEIRLAQLLGFQPKIWRDRKLGSNDLFQDEVFRTIAESALLLSVLSPHYLSSEWCLRELRVFYEQKMQEGGILIDGKSRLFKVVKTPIPREEHPTELQNMLGYDFYEEDAATGRFREYVSSTRSSSNLDRRYWEQLDDLAQDIAATIRKVRQPQSVTPLSGKTIYLAETTSDLSGQRDRVRRELQMRGHRVLPEEPLPYTRRIWEEVQWLLAEAHLAVHLIGANYGLVPEDETLSVAEIQYELAAKRKSDSDFTQILWLPNEVNPTDERQQRFIDKLLNSNSDGRTAELLRDTLEDLKTYIEQKLKPRPISNPPRGTNGKSSNAAVYLICDKPDYDSLQLIEDSLYDLGFEVIPPPGADADTLVLQYHKEMLLACDAVMIYYGSANEMWVRMQLRELQKHMGYGREKPLLAKAVYIGPPETERKRLFRTLEAIVIKNFGSFTPDVLTPFIDQIRRATDAG